MTDSTDKSYDINFFKPLAGMTRDNNRIITVFIIIWFLAVFGFQFLLIGTNKLTPEQTLITFNEVWPGIESGEAEKAEQQAFGKTMLMVLGKNIALEDGDKAVLKEALSLNVGKLVAGGNLEPATAAKALALGDGEFDQLMIELLPYSLVVPTAASYSSDLPSIMEKYCTHPQGPLTNFRFMGFPFHYWYTAQFLLILFVVLCLLYAIKIEKIHKKHNFVEEQN